MADVKKELVVGSPKRWKHSDSMFMCRKCGRCTYFAQQDSIRLRKDGQRALMAVCQDCAGEVAGAVVCSLSKFQDNGPIGAGCDSDVQKL